MLSLAKGSEHQLYSFALMPWMGFLHKGSSHLCKLTKVMLSSVILSKYFVVAGRITQDCKSRPACVEIMQPFTRNLFVKVRMY